MAVTEIPVCANGPGLLESRLKSARQVADRFASHVEVIFFREAQSLAAVPMIGTAFNASPRHDLAQPARDQETGRMARAKDAFDRWMASAGTGTAKWSTVAGSAADLLPSRARACDLIVAGGPGEGSSSSTLDDAVSATALLSSGRMTLLAPRPEHLAGDTFRRVLIAWDDSAAVARTMAQAMPLIAAAGEVRLLVGETSPENATSCNEILAYLRRKGARPGVARSAPAFRTVRETLVRQARELEASLIVMAPAARPATARP